MAAWTFAVAKRSLERVKNAELEHFRIVMIRNLGAQACEEHSEAREEAYSVDIFSLQGCQPSPCF